MQNFAACATRAAGGAPLPAPLPPGDDTDAAAGLGSGTSAFPEAIALVAEVPEEREGVAGTGFEGDSTLARELRAVHEERRAVEAVWRRLRRMAASAWLF